MKLLYIYLPMFLLSFGLTGLLRRYSLKKKVLDVPNPRSSHCIPTPRGGGLAFVVCFLGVLIELAWDQKIDLTLFWTIFVSSMIVAVFGFWDDWFHLSAKSRLIGHIIAAMVVIYGFSDASQWILFSENIPPSLVYFFAVIYLIWCINLFNFMDGIDGLAAIETMTVCLGGALLYFIGGQFELLVLPLLLACVVAGFLIWNFPPARIFMGDVGSGFLGLLIGVFSLIAATEDSSLFLAWFILNGVFFCDASITLLRRLWRQENIFKAHCSHAYQLAARRYHSHQLVTLSILTINCCWLLPIALMVQQHVFSGFFGVILAFTPLILLVLKFDANR